MCLPEAMWLNVIQVEKAKHPMKQRIVLMERKNKKKEIKLTNGQGFSTSEALHAFGMKSGFLFCLKVPQGELKSEQKPDIGPYYGNIPAFPALTRRVIYSLPITLCFKLI